jgi:hypothetical protein
MPSQIPKRIIQTGRESTPPLAHRAAIANLTLLNPDFEYCYFNNSQVELFIDEVFPQYRPIFDGFPFKIQRYDFFRYLAVFHYGGFYFDLDVFLATGLGELLDCGCVFPFEGLTFSHFLRKRYSMDWQIGNYAFGAAPGDRFLHAVIENCVRAQQEPRWIKPMMRGMPLLSRAQFHVLNTTGPGLLSRTLAENPRLAGDVTVLFPDDVCNMENWNRFGELGIHLMDGSWRGQEGFLRSRLARRWEDQAMRKLVVESMKLGKTRQTVSPTRHGPLHD